MLALLLKQNGVDIDVAVDVDEDIVVGDVVDEDVGAVVDEDTDGDADINEDLITMKTLQFNNTGAVYIWLRIDGPRGRYLTEYVWVGSDQFLAPSQPVCSSG